MLKKNQAMKLILLAGALSFPVTGMAEQMPNQPRTSISQQNGKVTGTVEDALGTVIGATVVVKGTTNGTTTDIDGRFTLEGVKKGSILQISFVGYTTKEVKYTGQSVLKIMLQEDTKTLDEVVVVGFGTQKKVNLTGSVGTVDSEALASRPVQNAVQALQGVVPGLQITTTSGALDNKMSMSIRGTGTIGDGSDASPLVLIDGMEGDINSINPQDIENISILKDAAAASIYGSRAPFGVILVTTKSGKSGKTTINYNNNFRWGQPVRIPKQMDSYTFATFYNDANINSGAGAYFNAEHLQRIKDYQDGKITDGVLADANNKYWLDGYAGGNANTDWYDVIYREWTSSQEHNLSFSGGNDKVNYYISGNFMDQKGLMEFNQDTYKRYTGTGKINAQLTDWAKVNYTSRFTREDFHRPAYLTNALFRDLARQGWPTLPVYDPNGYMFHSPSPALPLRDGGKHNIQTDNIYQQISLILEPIKNWITHVDFNYRINTVNNHWDTQTLYNHDVQGNPYPIGYYQDTEAHEDQTKENYMNFNAYTEYSHSLESGHSVRPAKVLSYPNYLKLILPPDWIIPEK